MTVQHHVLIRFLIDPACAETFGLSDWDLLIRQARRANLLPRVGVMLAEHGCQSLIPEPARWHFEASEIGFVSHVRAMRREIGCLQEVFAQTGLPLILLKGGAYLAADLHVAQGRMFSDIDILVAKEKLPAVEEMLIFNGWRTIKLDDYDQRYYRQWMHELPPFEHYKRRTQLDVHHTLLPETSRLKPDPGALLDHAIDVQGWSNVKVLSPNEMILHSITHLFHEGELDNGLRDLVDIRDLLVLYMDSDDAWNALLECAVHHQLCLPLYYALRYCQSILGLGVPDEVVVKLNTLVRPTGLLKSMDSLFMRGLLPNHTSMNDRGSAFARWLLYVRAHYLRMPLYLLVPHLLRKALRKRHEAQDDVV